MTLDASDRREAAPAGFRRFRVAEKRRENRLITSFVLDPLEAADWRGFEPGQFLVLRVPGPGGRMVPKQYSVSSSPRRGGRYRITVKREAAPTPDLPDGIGSCYLHDRIEPGAIIEAQGPRGEFTLDQSSDRPVVLLSGGVGLTPMLSMLDVLAHGSTRRVTYIHACIDGGVHAMRDEVAALAAVRDGIAVRTIYQTPTAADRAAANFDAEGLLSRDMLQAWLPLDDYEFYLCGPTGFMTAAYDLLRGLAVTKERIAYEFFGPVKSLEELPQAPAPVEAPPVLALAGTPTVTFTRSGITAPWPGGSTTLLEFAETLGLKPEFSCRAGICGTCRTKLDRGDVRYTEEPLEMPDAGQALICICQPAGPIALDL